MPAAESESFDPIVQFENWEYNLYSRSVLSFRLERNFLLSLFAALFIASKERSADVTDRKNNYLHYLLFTVIAVYAAFICWINFLGNPYFYDSDLYCDLNYMVTAWKTKSIFPEGWVFGDQFYVAATPVLAALCYGLLGDPCMAMGLASTLMAGGGILSFLWMMKPICHSRNAEMVGLLTFLTITLFVEYPVRAITGWQIFFTMCSYYACYLISAFLSFGVYVRLQQGKTKSISGLTVISCLLSFAMGMHSIRQTAVMVLPMIAVEFCAVVAKCIKKESVQSGKLLFVAAVTVCNLAGIATIRRMDLPKKLIFGSVAFKPMGDILPSIVPSFLTAFSLGGRRIPAAAFGILVVGILLLWLVDSIRKRDWDCLSLIGLLTVSVGAIFAASVLTQIVVRDIYYFMLFPLVGVLGMWVFDQIRFSKLAVPAVCVLLCAACLTVGYRGKNVMTELRRWSADPHPVVEYLLDNDITTVYTCWNDYQSISVGIASDWDIQVGFWHAYEDIAFKKFDFLCNPDVFNSAPSNCAYVFSSPEMVELAQASAADLGAELQLLKKYDDLGLWIYTAEQNLMN